MDRTDKIWLYGGVSFSLIASLVIGVSFNKLLVTTELAAAGTSIKVCDLIFGESDSKTIAWMNRVNNYLEMYNHNPVYEKMISDYVLPNFRDALRRCESRNPVPDHDFDFTADNLLMADKRFASPAFYDDMENVRESIVKHWGKDSPKLISMYGDGQDILNCLSCRYLSNQNDQNIDYSVSMGFEACRLAKKYNNDQLLLSTSQNLIKIGEYYFVKKQYAKAFDFYNRVKNCIPTEWPEQEAHFQALIKERIETAKKAIRATS